MFFLEMMMVVMMWASFKYDDDEDNGYDHENDDEDDDDKDDDDEDYDADEPHFLRFLPARRNTGALPSSLSMWRKYVGNRPDQWPFQSRFIISYHIIVVIITISFLSGRHYHQGYFAVKTISVMEISESEIANIDPEKQILWL